VTAGEVAEWLMAPVLKTGVPERVPGVRIPPSPPLCFIFSKLYAGDTSTDSELNRGAASGQHPIQGSKPHQTRPNQRTMQQWLGHSDLESTMRYLKPSRSQQVREKVNEIFGGVQ
jgi:hypothetical protein